MPNQTVREYPALPNLPQVRYHLMVQDEPFRELEMLPGADHLALHLVMALGADLYAEFAGDPQLYLLIAHERIRSCSRPRTWQITKNGRVLFEWANSEAATLLAAVGTARQVDGAVWATFPEFSVLAYQSQPETMRLRY